MTEVPSAPVTRGRLTALWLVLRTVQKLGGRSETAEVLTYARRSSLRGGGLPLTDGFSLARQGGFVTEEQGIVIIAPLGTQALDLVDQDEPSPAVVRLFLSVLLLRDPPTWVAWWQGDPTDLERVVPAEQRRLMEESGLFPVPGSDDAGGWGWWRALERVPLPEQTAADRKVIGNAGEELTVAFERRRLTDQGYPELAGEVTWVAQQSDAYGFDVLSFAGDDLEALDATVPIAIEVKSTTLPATETFRFFLTHHEWETAEALGDRYVIYLWSRIDPGPPPSTRAEAPVVVNSSALADHLPGSARCGEECAWQAARLVLPSTALGPRSARGFPTP
jgi:hypothetical protein